MSTVCRVHASARAQQIPFVLSYFPSTDDVPRPISGSYAVDHTAQFWQQWAEMEHVELGKWCEPSCAPS